MDDQTCMAFGRRGAKRRQASERGLVVLSKILAFGLLLALSRIPALAAKLKVESTGIRPIEVEDHRGGNYRLSGRWLVLGATFFGLIVTVPSLSGVAVGGQIDVAQTGSPAHAPPQQMPGDGRTLRGYGYIGDGASHVLASVATFNGVSTVGWTVGQWRSLLPAAGALSDEIDWAATQSYIQTANTPIAIHFPAGTGIFNKALVVCTQSVSFYGQGGISYASSTVTLRFTKGTDGISRCVRGPNTTIEIHNIKITSQYADDHDTPGRYITSALDGTATSGVNDTAASLDFIEDTQIDGFTNCLNLENGQGTHLRFVFCNSTQPPGAKKNIGYGIRITGVAAFVNHWDNILVQNYYVGYWFYSNNNYSGLARIGTVGVPGQAGIEDTQVRDSACGGVRTCIRIDSVDPYYGPFSYAFDNMSVDATSQFIDAPTVNDLVVTGGNWLIDPAIPNSTWGASVGGTGERAPLNMINIGSVTKAAHMVRLRDMWFGQGSDVVIRSLVSVEAGGGDVQMTGNKIETAGMNVVDGYFHLAAGVTQVIERDTSWQKSFAPIDPPANAISNEARSPTNRLESVALGTLTPSNLSKCGASPSIRGTNAEGVITEGLGATGCTVSFKPPRRANDPVCVFQPWAGRTSPFRVNAVTRALFTFSHSAAPLTVSYRCTPY